MKKFISILLLLNFSVALFGGDIEEKSGSGSGCGAGASVSDTADATVGVGAGAGAGASRKRSRSEDGKKESNASRYAVDNGHDTPKYTADSREKEFVSDVSGSGNSGLGAGAGAGAGASIFTAAQAFARKMIADNKTVVVCCGGGESKGSSESEEGFAKKYFIKDLLPFELIRVQLEDLSEEDKIYLPGLEEKDLDLALEISKKLINKEEIVLEINELEKCIRKFEYLSAKEVYIKALKTLLVERFLELSQEKVVDFAKKCSVNIRGLKKTEDILLSKGDMISSKEEDSCWSEITWFSGVKYSADGSKILTLTGDSGFRIVDATTKESIVSVNIERDDNSNEIIDLFFYSNDEKIIILLCEGEVGIYDIATGIFEKNIYKDKPMEKYVDNFSDGKKIAEVISKSSLNIIDIASGSFEELINNSEKHIKLVAFSPTDSKLVIGFSDNRIEIWDYDAKKCIRTIKGVGIDTNFSFVIFSPDGKTIATLSLDKCTLKIYDVETGRCKLELPQSNEINAISFSPNGKIIAMELEGDLVKLWNIESEKCALIHEISNASNGTSSSIAISPKCNEILLAVDGVGTFSYIFNRNDLPQNLLLIMLYLIVNKDKINTLDYYKFTRLFSEQDGAFLSVYKHND